MHELRSRLASRSYSTLTRCRPQRRHLPEHAPSPGPHRRNGHLRSGRFMEADCAQQRSHARHQDYDEISGRGAERRTVLACPSLSLVRCSQLFASVLVPLCLHSSAEPFRRVGSIYPVGQCRGIHLCLYDQCPPERRLPPDSLRCNACIGLTAQEAKNSNLRAW